MMARLLSALLLLLLSQGCSGPDKVPPVPANSRVVVAKPGDPVGLDPANVTDLESLHVTRQIFDTLVQYAPNSTEVVPGLAHSWDLAEDGLSLTFHLREGVKFHDGTPLDAAAVKANYDRQTDPEHPLRSPGDTFFYWNDSWGSPSRLSAIEVVDALTVRFVFREPVAPVMQNLAMPFFGISSPTALKKYGADAFRHPVGTGPYRFEEWLPGERVVLKRNDDYWGGPPSVEELVFLPVPDSTARGLRLRKGSVHLSTAISPQSVEGLRRRDSVEVVEEAGLNVAYLALNNQVPGLDDLRVRRAIWHAVDRPALLRALYYGLADPADTALPRGVWSRLEASEEARLFDPALGRELMEKAGYDEEHPLHLELWYMTVPRSYFPEPKATAEAIARMLEEVHIQCRIEPIDWSVYLDRIGRGEHQLALAGWIGDHGDPDNYLSFLFAGANIDTEAGGTNVLLYQDQQVDAWLEEARSLTERERRDEIYRKIQQKVYDDACWLPIAHARQVVGVHPELGGFAVHPTGVLLLHNLEWQR